MTCDEFRDKLSDLSEDPVRAALSPETAKHIEHMMSCSFCQEWMARHNAELRARMTKEQLEEAKQLSDLCRKLWNATAEGLGQP